MTTATMADERILTLHPEGKQGVRIDRRKYEGMKRAILKVTPRRAPGVRFTELRQLVRAHLPETVYTPDVSISWYLTTVKLDLEARRLIARVPGSGPQRLVRTGARR